MGKQLQSRSAIVKQSSEPSLTPEQQRVALIGTYLAKFATIANRGLDDSLIAIYAEALDDLDADRVRKGLVEYLKVGEKWPWPGTLREYIEAEI